MKQARPTRYLAILALGLATALPQLSQAAPTGAGQPAVQKVVFQVSDNDPKKWDLALNNARNVQQELGAGNVDIELVAYGPGINMLKLESPAAGRIDEAEQAGIRIVACQNTMKAQKLTKEDMLPSVGYVPAGVVEIMKKEREGYAYIRP